MLFSKLATAASLVGATFAAPASHAHNQHKRGVVVVTETHTVVVTADVNQVVAGESTTYTFSTLNTDLVSATSASTTVTLQGQVAGASTYSGSTDTAAATTSAVATTSSEATTSTSSTKTSSSSTAAAETSSSSNFSAGAKGITYSPYTDDGNCKSLSEVESDLAQISDYEMIRLYGVDCDQVENVLQAKADGQKLFLGLYYMDQIEAGVETIASAIESYGSWDDVYTVSVGNELVNGGSATVSQVSSYVSTARSALESAGYTGPVVSVDTHVAVIANTGLCEISDYIAINAHAYFDYNTEAADAGEWLLLQIQRVWTACGGEKSVFVTETGWPHKGDTYGVAVASPEAQSAAISSIKSSCGSSAILFTAFDDLWKADGAQNCEKYWGLN